MRIGRAVVFFVLALAGAVVVWLGAGSLRAARRERVAEAAWADSFGPLRDFTAKFPAHPANEAARSVEESVRSLGLAFRHTAWVQYEAAKGLREMRLRTGSPFGRFAALAGAWRDRVEAAAYLDAWRATIDAAAKSPVADTQARILGETFQQALARNGVRRPPRCRISSRSGAARTSRPSRSGRRTRTWPRGCRSPEARGAGAAH